jgi:hypothetical protein
MKILLNMQDSLMDDLLQEINTKVKKEAVRLGHTQTDTDI